MSKNICKNCKYCCLGMRASKFVYSCIKIRGGDNDGFDFDYERMPIKAHQEACTFYTEDN